MRSAKDAARGAQAVLEAVSDGDLTPSEGASVMGLIEQYRRSIELSDLEKRVEALEAEGPAR